MAIDNDILSSLPVRTETNGDVVAQLVDGINITQKLTINADGSINVTDNGASLTVDATDLDIRDLTEATDSVSVFQATHDNLNANANIQVGNADVANGNPVPVSDAGASLTVDATDLDIRDLVAATDSIASYLNDGAGTPITSTTTGAKQSLDVILKDAGGNNLGTTMYPLSVVTSVNTEGDEVNDLNKANNVAIGGNADHIYTVPVGKIFYFTGYKCNSRIKSAYEIAVEKVPASNTFVSIAVEFLSAANGNSNYKLAAVETIPAGGRVKITKYNQDLTINDLFSTISGILVNA